MATFNVSVSGTVTVYGTVEVEAVDADEARAKVEAYDYDEVVWDDNDDPWPDNIDDIDDVEEVIFNDCEVCGETTSHKTLLHEGEGQGYKFHFACLHKCARKLHEKENEL